MLRSEMKSVRGIIVHFGFTASPSAWPLCPISIMLVLMGLVYILYGENILALLYPFICSHNGYETPGFGRLQHLLRAIVMMAWVVTLTYKKFVFKP